MNRLEVNAVVRQLKSREYIPSDYELATSVADLIAHIYDVCVRHNISEKKIKKEINSIIYERVISK